jgi:histidinol-phosphate/aromatic aminotransferase/cobyric acid decarboxylase-like protein
VTERAEATGVPLEPDLTLDPDRVAAAIRPNTRLILTNFPNSPTGSVLDAGRQDALVALCRARGLWLVNDEVYRQTTYDPTAQARPIAEDYERGVSLNALSKGFGLPGLRVGWVASRDAALLRRVVVAKALLSSCLSTPAELLAEVALREETRLVGAARALGLANRRHLDAVLDRYPGLFEPDPVRNLAFAFPRFRGREGAMTFARRLASDAGVVLLPSGLWSSPLGAVPEDGLRIALGQQAVPLGLQALSAFLQTRSMMRTRRRPVPGIAPLLIDVISVDRAKSFKPDPRCYELVGPALGVATHEVLFVSSNGFDVAGAKQFGFTVAWIERDRGRAAPENSNVGPAEFYKLLRGRAEVLGCKPDFRINSLTDLTSVVPSLAR